MNKETKDKIANLRKAEKALLEAREALQELGYKSHVDSMAWILTSVTLAAEELEWLGDKSTL